MDLQHIETKSPTLQKLPNGGDWVYADVWKANIFLKNDGALYLCISPGYRTDLASVPRPLRGAFDNGSGEFGVLVASQVHDMLYSTHYLSKDFADTLFHDILRYYGMNRLKAWLYYQAVHLFGDEAWEVLSDDEMEKDRKLCSLHWADKPGRIS